MMLRTSFKAVLALTAGMVVSTMVHADDEGVPLHGFADAGMGYSSMNTPSKEQVRTGYFGTVDFYLTPEFEGGVKSLMEIAVEPSSDNGGVGVDAERVQLGYTVSDSLTLWVGRFHTPIGYWNTAYHHGGQLQTSIYRPYFLNFEDKGGVLPAHTVGAWATGSTKVGDSKLRYNFWLANSYRIFDDGNGGTGAGHLDFNPTRNDKDGITLGYSASWGFGAGALDGLQLGIHAFASQVGSYLGTNSGSSGSVDPKNAPTHLTNVQMLGAFLAYESERFEAIGEIYSFGNKDANVSSADTKKSTLEYIQVAYAVNEKNKPFARYEKTSLASDDNYFADQEGGLSYMRWAVGLRHELTPKAALKFEMAQTSVDASAVRSSNALQYNLYNMQYAVRF